MKIKRTIHGEEIEIELTQEEITEAYNEKEHYYDCEVVRGNLSSSCYEEFSSLSEEELEDAIHEIAYDKRHEQDKYGLDESDAVDVAREQYVQTHFSNASQKQEAGELLHMEFSSKRELRNWLDMNRQQCDNEEEFLEWLEQFFEDGNTVAVNGETWDLDDCAVL